MSYAQLEQGGGMVLQGTSIAGMSSLLEHPCGTKHSVLLPPHRRVPGVEGAPVKFHVVEVEGEEGQGIKDTVG